MWRRSSRDERGSVTVVAASMVATLLAVAVGGAYVGAVVVARHRAQAAADLAALAAAERVPAGHQSACAVAEEVASAMRAGSARCAVEDVDVVVTIDAPVGRWGTASAAARAGPA